MLLAAGLLLGGCQPVDDAGRGAAPAADAASGNNESHDGDTPTAATGSPQAARAVVKHYYQAIDNGDYRSAYALWWSGAQDNQNASGKTLQQFENGFAHTQSSRLETGKPGAVEGAAGSSYITIPVTVRATLDDGRRQRFTGRYTLRRVNNVDGASPAAQQWHIYSADLSAQ